MNIKILQAENSVERVDNNVIKNLYSAHKNGNISQEVDSNNLKIGLVGTIQADAGYGNLVSTLNSAYPKFHISVINEYLEFEDPNAERVCALYFGDGVGCTISDLANANFATTVNGVNFGTAFRSCGAIKFNEFLYFTGVANTSVGLTYPFRNNPTLTEFTLPSSCKTISSYTFSNGIQDTGANAPTINNLNNITYIDSFGFWGWNWVADEEGGTYDRLELDWRNIGGIWTNMYAVSNNFKGDVILPKYPTDAWTSSREFNIFDGGRGQYITKIVFPETFTCNNCELTRTNSCNVFIFLTQTPANGTINMWRNQNWGVGNDRHLYVPRILYDSLDMSATASDGTITYSSVLKINYGCVPEPLDNYANISDTNKDELVSYGCTATGSTGNWTITPPSA